VLPEGQVRHGNRPVIQRLYCELWPRLASAGVTPSGPALAYYEDSPAIGSSIVVDAAVAVDDEAGGHGFSVVDLAEVERAAVIIHRAPWTTCSPRTRSWRGGSTPTGTVRLATPGRSPWNSPPTRTSG
jgi:hypothetical protein